MEERKRVVLGLGIVVAIFLFVQLGALALVEPFDQVYDPVENPQDPTNTIYYVVAILVATGVMLAAFKLGVDELIRLLVVGSGAWLSLYVFSVLVPPAPLVLGINAIALVGAVAIGVGLYVYPEWYVIDTAGALMGAAGAGLFGISFGVLPALLLLTVLAVYDAISVYGTEHMLTLANGVMDLKVPVVLVIPLTLSYSFLDSDTPDATAQTSAEDDGSAADDDTAATPVTDGDVAADADGDDSVEGVAEEGPLERDALFIGLGDVVIPTVLVASAAHFASEGTPEVLSIPLPALTAMVGSFVGLAVLMRMVLKGRAHAGLPLLNGGTIGGYLVGALLSGLTLIDALGLAPYF
ncbi:presenilin family intramembrane aspartyl protease PSH [Halomicrobium katesii]|uniref:presenilin family intramembrane aspartyl protease PSH n=1 Tax=Halomicrobium katesii TaxID=437163 RepID=UPI00035C9329|nr:presenilin family intramembrane aspartyl protease PSH [Halomicrobium katesii]